MKRLFAAFLLTSCVVWAQPLQGSQLSAELLFVKSDSTAALRESAQELSQNPADLNAIFVQMEAARLQLRTGEELTSAVELLRKTHNEDLRARLAAERVHEMAANTLQRQGFVLFSETDFNE